MISIEEIAVLEEYNMKTRIISGIVMAAILAAVLTVGMNFEPVVITAFVAILAAAGTYELTYNAAGIKSKAAVAGACTFSFLYVFASDSNFQEKIYSLIPKNIENVVKVSQNFTKYWSLGVSALIIGYFLYAVVMVLKNHKDFGLSHIALLCGLPLPLCFAFSCLGSVINHQNGLYYLLMLLNFSSVCDMGAYFVGVTCGKHKLCPNISPKKTIEGAVGGIASSLIFAVVFMLIFNQTDKLVPTLIVTIPLCAVGMIGDLFASAIKRSVGLKDYSNLIPGHGGILDRVDSILLIAPVMALFVSFGVL